MKKKHIGTMVLMALAAPILLGCSHESEGANPSRSASIAGERISPQLAATKIRAGALIVDVRSEREFKEGHLLDAINIPHAEIANLAAREPNKEREIILYCASGRRAALAQESLGHLGYLNVYNAGGFSELSREGSSSDY